MRSLNAFLSRITSFPPSIAPIWSLANWKRINRSLKCRSWAIDYRFKVWLQKASKLCICNHLPDFAISGFNRSLQSRSSGQVITAWKHNSFLTPDMASKNDARHDIGLFHQWIIDAMSGIVFWVKKADVFSYVNHLPNFSISGFNIHSKNTRVGNL